MNRGEKNNFTKTPKTGAAHSAKECAYIAVFVALVIGAQVALTAIPGVELVTVLFVCYAFVMGARRGMVAATAFALLRQLVFDFFPTVLVLYLVYFNLLALCFGLMGKRLKNPAASLALITLTACVCTVAFTMLDNIITPLWRGFSGQGLKMYFMASLPFMGAQVASTAVTVALLFLPIYKAISAMKKGLK